MGYFMKHDAKFEDIIGETLIAIYGSVGDEDMVLEAQSGNRFRLYHYQDCCESVSIEDICGDLEDLIGSPILSAEEVVNPDDAPEPEYSESHTWTFYKLATIKGSVTIRWFGSSNGYYSESVCFEMQVSDDPPPPPPEPVSKPKRTRKAKPKTADVEGWA